MSTFERTCKHAVDGGGLCSDDDRIQYLLRVGELGFTVGGVTQ